MIRIELGRSYGRRRLRQRLALVAAIATAATAILFIVDTTVPLVGLWARWTGTPTEATPVAVPEVAAPVAGVAHAPGERPRRSDACRRVLRLSEGLPRNLSYNTLAARADGEYALRGASAAASVPILRAAVDSLTHGSDDVGLTYWHSGAVDSAPGLEFHLSGRVVISDGAELEGLTPAAALDLITGVEGRARASGLRQIVSEPLGSEALAPGTSRQSHRLWASGSYGQVRGFAFALAELESSARLAELVVAFADARVDAAAGAQVWASYDIVVTDSSQEEP